jgi:hypothetical protein
MAMVELNADVLSVIMEAVTPAGWVGRLVCRSLAVASTDGARSVSAKSVDSVERLEMARQIKGWVEPRDLCRWSAYNGHLEVLQWARTDGCPWDPSTCSRAAYNGNLEILQWARVNGCPWNELTCADAAENGNLEVLQWTCSRAALNGHLEVLKWARANGCPWNWRTCIYAARNGYLEVLKWARDNGCPWNEWTCSRAALNGHLEVLQWARANAVRDAWEALIRRYPEAFHNNILPEHFCAQSYRGTNPRRFVSFN